MKSALTLGVISRSGVHDDNLERDSSNNIIFYKLLFVDDWLTRSRWGW